MKDAARDALVELAPPLIVFSVGCLVAACLVILPGCTEEDNQRAEIMRLHGVIKMMSDEATRVSKTLPSEQPAVLAELDAAKKQLAEMRGEVEASKRALAAAKEATKGEVLPLSAWMKSIDAQMADHNARINACSRKGHTHRYHKGDNFMPSDTDPD
jgi:predicted  nucleic acid-binding Zn-ribbon protein